MSYIAHIAREQNGVDWKEVHELSEHLIQTSIWAKKFAKIIGADWAEVAGLWHDLGKYRKAFQDYIRLQTGYEKENAHIENDKRRPHSTAGAIYAIEELGPILGHVVAYLIAGHHAGLPDWVGGRGSLRSRLVEGLAEYNEALSEDIPRNILKLDRPKLPECATKIEVLSLWMRLVFSCLVDADFLDTEFYMQPDKTQKRKKPLKLNELQARFDVKMNELQNNSQVSDLNTTRNHIYQECLAASKHKCGMFSLTVPTGGGKTLSSLAFALEHARLKGKDRIIYAIPFTSIIEQNAKVFREFLGNNAVLEHHSNFDVASEKESAKARLVTENWDAPLIVTTNVQLFESLFASRTSRCRKLHNIVNSVVVLDEAQQIPRDFHAPITQMMQHMSDHFGVTWVLCTATQPVLTESKNNFGQLLLKGLNNVREIVANPMQLAEDLKRVEIEFPEDIDERTSWLDLSKAVSVDDCVLVIVNTRRHAKILFEQLNDDDNNVHLSANMCAEHRTEMIDHIKQRLKDRRCGDQRPIRVVSTQLIEAGVDISFPKIYRAMAGLDSIAQAAGRCNREGEYEMGDVIVFNPSESSNIGFLQQGEDITIELLKSGKLKEPLSPESFKSFFTQFNGKGNRDEQGIIKLLRPDQQSLNDGLLKIQFRQAAKRFRLINDNSLSVIVPFIPEGQKDSPVHAWLTALEVDPLQRKIYKKLQRYTISLPESIVKKYQDCIQEQAGQLVLLDIYYSEVFGLDTPDALYNPEDCVF